MGFVYDFRNRVTTPDVYIAAPSRDIIGKLSDVNLRDKVYFNNIDEATIEINKTNKHNHYDDINVFSRFLIVGHGWFLFKSLDKTVNGKKDTSKLSLVSLENELSSNILTSFGELGEYGSDSEDMYYLCNNTKPEKSLMHIALEDYPNWSIGVVDTAISSSAHAFSISETNSYELLTKHASESFGCIFQFDTFNRTVSVYDKNTLGEDSGIYLSFKNVMDDANFTYNLNDIYTKVVVKGGDDCGYGNLNINAVNPSGNSELCNYDTFLYTKFNDRYLMSDSLREHLIEYIQAYNDDDSAYASVLNSISTKYQELNTLKDHTATIEENWSDYGLYQLQEASEIQNVLLSQNIGQSNYSSIYSKIQTIQSYISSKNSAIATKENEIRTIETQRDGYRKNLSNYLTMDEIRELANFNRVTTFQNDTYIATTSMTDDEILQMKKELKGAGQEYLNEVSKINFTLKVTAKNFLSILGYENFRTDFKVGNFIHLDFDSEGKGRNHVLARLMSIEIDYENPDNFVLEFSSKFNLDGKFAFNEVLNQASSASKYIGYTSSAIRKSLEQTNDVHNFMNSTMNATRNKVVLSDGQEPIMDESGLHLKKYDNVRNSYSPNQLWGTNNGIYLSQDSFETISAAIGELVMEDGTVKYGIAGELILGKILMSQYMYFSNESGSMTYNGDGLTLYGANGGKNNIYINPNRGIRVTKIVGNVETDILNLDANTGSFNITMSGDTIDLTNNSTINGIRGNISELEQNLNEAGVSISNLSTNLQEEITRAMQAEDNTYTKSEVNSQISQSKNSIKGEIASEYVTKTTFDGLEIGGRNLYQCTKDFSGIWNNKRHWTADGYYNDLSVYKAITNFRGLSMDIEVAGGEVYTLSAYVKCPSGNVQFYANNDGAVVTGNGKKFGELTDFTRISATFTVSEIGNGIIRPRFENRLSTDIWICGYKLERGTKPTDWTPAPEDTDASIQAVDSKLVDYETISNNNTKLEQLENEIMGSVSESYATKATVQQVDGKFSQYTLKSDYNAKVSELSSGITAEVTARQEFETRVISPHVFNTGKKFGTFKFNTGTNSLSTKILKDTSSKLELLEDRFGVALNDNVNGLQGQIDLSTQRFSTQIANLQTNTSTQIEQLSNEVALRAKTSDLCNEISVSTDGINISGNRFTWSDTNSSKTADGIITCNGMVANSVVINTGTLTNGVYGSDNYSLISGGYIEAYNLRAISGGNISTLTGSGLTVGDGTYYYNSTAKCYMLTVEKINGSNPITEANIGSQSVSSAGYSEYATYSMSAGSATTAESCSTGYLTLSSGTLVAPNGTLWIGQNTVKAQTITELSSIRFKKEIEDYTQNALDIICNSNIKTYRYKNEPNQEEINSYKEIYDGYDYKKHIGLLVEESDSSITTQCEDGLDLGAMIAVSWKAIQEIANEITLIKSVVFQEN